MFGCTHCPTGRDVCPRCAARLCVEHIPFGNEVCAECEVAYQESRGTLKRWAWFLAGVALPWIFFAGIAEHLPDWSARSGGPRAITTGIPMLDVLIMFSIISVFAGKAMVGIREAFHRRAFVAAVPRIASSSRR